MSSTTKSIEATIESVLGALGQNLEAPEEQLDAVTGLSGSGPAYVFEFAAALRESYEEIALQADKVSLLGYLEPLITITGYRVFPVVALIEPDYQARPDGMEVAELFEAPLQLFLDQANEQPFQIEFRGEMRQLIGFDWQHHRIWGATASMLLNLRQRLQANP